MQEPTIASRLQELNKWQEEQKKLLNERQNMQRKLLGLEQRNMYQMLGLLHPSDTEQGDTNTQNVAAAQAPEKVDVAAIQNEPIVQDDDDECTQATLTQKTSGYSTDDPSVDAAAGGGRKEKKTFLKRGEGLKQRFKIHPDELRLDNLPRYKYSSSHPSLTSLRSRSSTDSIKPQVSSRINKATCNPQTKQQPTAQLDAQEQRFQQLLFASHNVCSSTPDTKSGQSSFEATGASQKIRFTEVSKESTPSGAGNNSSELSSTPGMATDGLAPISWAKVLDSQQIKPKIVHQIRTTPTTANASHDDAHHSVLDNITLFELLEQRAKDGSFDVNSSCIRNFMQRKMQEQQMAKDTDEIPVSQQLKECGLQPKVDQVFRLSGGGHVPDDKAHDSSTSSSSSSDNEDNESVGNNTTKQTNESHDDTATANTQTEHALPPSGKNCFRVRFTDDESISAQAMTTTSDTSTLVADESTMNNTEMFQQFKDALFSALQSRADKVTTEVQTAAPHSTGHSGNSAAVVTPVSPSDELQEKTNLIKERLAELEREIATFKDNNMQLIKAKQEHELQKAQFAQERFETVERLNDEKIQMEIYLHDERMKLEDEKRKFEQKVRNFKTTQNAIERKEVLRLKQEIDELQLQLKQKEQQHVTAQARLRAKVRNLEKDQKQLLDDIELLKKENKRLENDNVRICRENNNKMLYEINKNIAKLAPKLSPLNTCLDEAGGQKKPATMPNVKCNNVKKADVAMKNEKPAPKSVTITDNPTSGNTIKVHKTNDIGGRGGGNGGGDTPMNLNAIESMPEDYADESQQNTSANDSIVNAHVLRSAMQNSNKSSVNAAEFKREIINADGSKDIWYPNGNLKKISADAMTIRMLYFNKDIKETNIHEGTVKYYYADTNTWHTTYLDGLEILEFPNGQTEHRYKDGTVEVHFPNNTVKVTNPADEHKLEEWRFADGTNLLQLRNGDRILMFPNGQKEIHTKLNKRREYPDGTVKLVYPDGSQETRYSNGRVRLKDKDGKLIMDTETINQ